MRLCEYTEPRWSRRYTACCVWMKWIQTSHICNVRDSIYAMWKLFICIFNNACAHKTYSEQFSVKISLWQKYWGKVEVCCIASWKPRRNCSGRIDFEYELPGWSFLGFYLASSLASTSWWTFLLCSSPLRGPVGCLKQTDWKLLMGIQTMLIWHIWPF